MSLYQIGLQVLIILKILYSRTFQPIAHQFAISVSSSQLCMSIYDIIRLNAVFWIIIVGMCREVDCNAGAVWDWKTGCFRYVAAYSVMVCCGQNTTPV